MKGRNAVRRSRRVFLGACALLVVSSTGIGRGALPTSPGIASPQVVSTVVTPAESPGGSVRLCALGIGMVVGGILGMSVNPMGGATAISLGLHLAAFSC